MSDFARNLDWNLLYTFMVVVQNESMTKAADELLRSQPAVSLAIKRLEESTGKRLLIRKGNSLAVTPAGQALFERASEIYSTISRLPLTFEKAPRALAGKITMACIDHVESEELDAHIKRFFAVYPSVELEILVATTADVIRMVELGSATFGVCDGVIPKGLTSSTLVNERYGLYCGADYHLAGQTGLAPIDLRGEPFIGFTADVLGGSHMGEVTAFRARASIGQYVRGQSSNVHEVRRMIECGLGIGFLPTHLADPFVAKGSLFRLPPYEKEPTAKVYLISNPAIALSAAELIMLKDIQFGEPAKQVDQETFYR
ncbi:LysR family transcriptional regulator [Ruegeria sp.]|uniref:LysR family transcriptional regulator n=1 Tax=Ruegeria sp. TaxID=1879320 RepID=UPI0023288A11|nr:LysR family transcriptional regulator [Ruegeria sp.]MDA7966952.1 LysR family transcriptional regulator [Ruegeria sp.]